MEQSNKNIQAEDIKTTFNDNQISSRPNKTMFYSVIVLVLMLFGVSGAFAYQVISQKISACQPNDTKVCYEIKYDAENISKPRYEIKNLPSGKKYRFSIKRRLSDERLVDVNQTVVTKLNTSAKCTDTDNGIDFFKKGEITWTTQNFKDVDICKGTELTEYYCEGDMYKTVTRICSGGCVDGACKTDVATGSTNNLTPGTACVDTEPNVDQYVWGYVTNGSNYIKDSCINSNTVLDVYCSDALTVARKEITCVHDCVNGVCTEQLSPESLKCSTDSVAAYNDDPYINDLVKWNNQSFSDFCESEKILHEFYCDPSGEFKEKRVTCLKVCNDDKCTDQD